VRKVPCFSGIVVELNGEGNAMDKEGILYLNSNENPWILQMVDTEIWDKQVASNGIIHKYAATHNA